MSLTAAQVNDLAAVAQIDLTEEEIQVFTTDLNRTLRYVEKIRLAPLPDLEPTINGAELTGVWREDEVRPSWSQDAVLSNAPQKANACFQTPRVLDEV